LKKAEDNRESHTVEIKEIKTSQVKIKNAITKMHVQVEANKNENEQGRRVNQ